MKLSICHKMRQQGTETAQDRQAQGAGGHNRGGNVTESNIVLQGSIRERMQHGEAWLLKSSARDPVQTESIFSAPGM